MEFRNFLNVIFRHRQMIIIMCLSAMITATLITYVLSEKYRSSVVVLIRPVKSVELIPKREEVLNFPISIAIPIETASKTYTEIIKNRVMAERIVNLMGLDRMKEDEGTGLRYIWKKSKKMAKDFLKKTWTLLKYGRIEKENPFESAVAEVKGGLSVKPTKDTYMFEIQTESASPHLSPYIANAAAKILVEYLHEIDDSDAEGANKLNEGKVKLYMKELEGKRNALAGYKERYGISAFKSQVELEAKSLNELENNLRFVTTEIAETEAKMSAIKLQLSRIESFVKSESKITDNPLARTLKLQLADRMVKLAGLFKKYTTEHKEVQALQSEIDEIKARIRNESPTLSSEETSAVNPVYRDLTSELSKAETTLQSLEAKRDSIARVVKEKKLLLKEIPRREADLADMELSVTLSEENYKILSKEYEEIKISKAKKAPDIRVISEAVVPIYPVKPIKVYYAGLAGIMSILIGMAIALLTEHMNLMIRSVDEAENAMSVPVLAAVSDSGNRKSGLSSGLENSFSDKLSGGFEEEIRGLRSQLKLFKDSGMSSFLFTGCSPEIGTSTVISVLATSLAADSKRVILLDADVRSPSLHKKFGLSNEKGLFNIMSGEDEPRLNTHESGLSILTAGLPQGVPSTLFSSDGMLRLLNRLGDEFDFILIDSAPALECSDTVAISSLVSGTFVVFKSGITSAEDVKRVKKLFERAKAKVLGTVLTGYDKDLAG